MKKLLIALLLPLIASCATMQIKKSDLFSNITLDNVRTSCEPVESWRVGVLGLMSYVYKFDDCLNVKALLAISIDTESYTEEVRQTSIKLLASHYLAYLNREEEEVEGVKKAYSIEKIKEETADTWKTHFFVITYKKIKCSDGTCKEVK